MFISRDPVSNRGNEINVTTYYKIKNIVAVFGFGFLPRICLSKWHRFQNVILAAGIYQIRVLLKIGPVRAILRF